MYASKNRRKTTLPAPSPLPTAVPSLLPPTLVLVRRRRRRLRCQRCQLRLHQRLHGRRRRGLRGLQRHVGLRERRGRRGTHGVLVLRRRRCVVQHFLLRSRLRHLRRHGLRHPRPRRRFVLQLVDPVLWRLLLRLQGRPVHPLSSLPSLLGEPCSGFEARLLSVCWTKTV
ncbi:unnamed protein product [Ectocarpus fasciculatus]